MNKKHHILMFLPRIYESAYCFCGWYLNAAPFSILTHAHTTLFSIQIFIVSDRLFASSTLRNVLKLNEPIKWIVTDDLLPQTWNEKVSLIGWGGFMFSSISNYNKIATNLSSKTTIDNNCYQDYFCHWLPPVNIS